MTICYKDENCVVVKTQEDRLIVFIIKSYPKNDCVSIYAINEKVRKNYTFSIEEFSQSIDEDKFWGGMSERFIKDCLDCQINNSDGM